MTTKAEFDSFIAGFLLGMESSTYKYVTLEQFKRIIARVDDMIPGEVAVPTPDDTPAATEHAPIIVSGDSVPADVPAAEGSDPTVDVMASPSEVSGGDE